MRREVPGAGAYRCRRLGERNELRLRERGVVEASAHELPALIEQLSAALATGNSLWIGTATLYAALAGALPASLVLRLQSTNTHPAGASSCRAVLVDAPEARAEPGRLAQLRQELAGREGPLVPVVLSESEAGYDLLRLISEQAVSTNTAALGGDVALLDLAEDDTPPAD